MNENLLGDLAPKTPEQERIFKEAIEKILRKVAIEKKIKQNNSLVDPKGIFKTNKKLRNTDGFSKDREFRMIALVPVEMAEIAKKMYGDDVLINKEKFKKAFVQDETGRYCLTVDPKTI